MALTIHVPGVALIRSGTGGAGALEDVGISEDGVDVTINNYDAPVMADTGGPNIPVDIQDMGFDGIVRARLVIWDAAVLDKHFTRGSASAVGQLPAIGELVQSNGHSFRLLIDTPSEPYNFPVAYLRGPQSSKRGTRRAPFDCTWYVWAPIGVSTAALNTLLYNATDS